jgi:hypothetical protein
MNKIDLQEDQALVLQQVAESGEEDLTTLTHALRFDRRRLVTILQALHHKGLIFISQDSHQDPWVRISARGRRMMLYLWPEAQLRMA